MYCMEDIRTAMDAYRRRTCSMQGPRFCHMSPAFRHALGVELEQDSRGSVTMGDGWLHAQWHLGSLRGETVCDMTIVVHPEYGYEDSVMWVGGLR